MKEFFDVDSFNITLILHEHIPLFQGGEITVMEYICVSMCVCMCVCVCVCDRYFSIKCVYMTLCMDMSGVDPD